MEEDAEQRMEKVHCDEDEILYERCMTVCGGVAENAFLLLLFL